MAYKVELSDLERKVFGKLDPEHLKKFGIKDKGDKMIQKNPSWDGDSFDEWEKRATTERVRYGKDGQTYNMSSLDPLSDMPDEVKYENPKQAGVYNALDKTGIPKSEWDNLAREAGVNNINSKNDLIAMLKVWQEMENPQSELDRRLGRERDDDDDDDDEKDEGSFADTFAPFDKGYELSQHWKDLHNDLSVKPPKMYEKQEEEVEKPDDSEEAAKLFTNKYATDIAKNIGIREERRLNLENAMYDAPEFNPFA